MWTKDLNRILKNHIWEREKQRSCDSAWNYLTQTSTKAVCRCVCLCVWHWSSRAARHTFCWVRDKARLLCLSQIQLKLHWTFSRSHHNKTGDISHMVDIFLYVSLLVKSFKLFLLRDLLIFMEGVHWRKIGEGSLFFNLSRREDTLLLIWVLGRVTQIWIDQILDSFLPRIHKSLVGSFNDSPLPDCLVWSRVSFLFVRPVCWSLRLAYPDSGRVQYLANQWLSSGIRLFHTGRHCNSKTRRGWACTAEMFHSWATTPEDRFSCMDVILLPCPWV